MRFGLVAVAGAALALSACADSKVWMRSGATSFDAELDESSCAEEAERSGVSISLGGDPSPGMDRFSQRFACLRSRGYRLIPLTSEESAKLKALGGDEKEAFWRTLLAKNGFGSPPAPPPGDGLPRAPAQ